MRLLEKSEIPAQLMQIPQPPARLYLEGNLPSADAICLCVVGPRKYSDYGKKACEKLIGCLTGKNVAIISGLAIGIDSIAHRAALDAGLFTLALPGSGLNRDVLYPHMNIGLAEKILSTGGGLLSEFEPGFIATPWSFPQRNRLMAGLAKAVLVIEAGVRSGTLITARLGLEYNRDVLAVPGSIFSPTSVGPNALIHAGATPIACPDDLFEALGFERENENREKNHPNSRKYTDCTSEEREILDALVDAPLSRDMIIQAVAKSITDVNVLLSVLEIKGHVREKFGLIELT